MPKSQPEMLCKDLMEANKERQRERIILKFIKGWSKTSEPRKVMQDELTRLKRVNKRLEEQRKIKPKTIMKSKSVQVDLID